MTVGNLNCNQGLYDSGLSFARALPPSISGWPPRAVLEPIANRRGTSVAEVRTAIRFVDDVKLVSSTVGAGAKALLLSGMNAILTPVLIGKIAKLSPARIKSAIARAEAGLNPFAGPIPAGVPRGQAFWHHDLLRLHQATELLEDADSGLARLSKSERDAIFADATAIKVAASAVLFRLESVRGGEEPRDLVLNSSASDTTNLPKRVRSGRRAKPDGTASRIRSAEDVESGSHQGGRTPCRNLVDTFRR